MYKGSKNGILTHYFAEATGSSAGFYVLTVVNYTYNHPGYEAV